MCETNLRSFQPSTRISPILCYARSFILIPLLFFGSITAFAASAHPTRLPRWWPEQPKHRSSPTVCCVTSVFALTTRSHARLSLLLSAGSAQDTQPLVLPEPTLGACMLLRTSVADTYGHIPPSPASSCPRRPSRGSSGPTVQGVFTVDHGLGRV